MTQRTNLKLRALGLRSCMLALLLASGCGHTDAFATRFPANRGPELKAALARAKQAPAPQLPQVVVGVTDQPRGVFAYDLENQRLLFTQPAEVTGVPVAAGHFAVVPEGKSVRVRKLASGASILDIPAEGMHLVGAASDGAVTAIALSTGGSMGARARLVVLEGERVSANLSVERHLGGPAVLGGLVFVPHNRVHFSVLDPRGEELARVQVREDVASQALTHEGEVYFGQNGIYRLDEQTALGASGGARYFKLTLEEKLPGQPAFLPNTADPPPAVNSAVHKVSLSFVPALQGDRVGLLDDAFYLLFYRQIFALDPHGTQARWVQQTESDCVGMRAVSEGVLVVEESGALVVLDRTGGVVSKLDMGVVPVVAHVQADRLPGGAAAGPQSAPLTMQLVDAALNPDARLVPARAMAVELLARLDDADATAALIEICQDHATPERVRTAACVSLSKRQNGAEAIATALQRRADFLARTEAPPVGPLAQAASNIGDPTLVGPLLAHVADPHTPSEELPSIMRALAQLASAEHAGPIADFLRTYHADAEEERMVDALIIAIEALKKLQGSEAQGVLSPIASDPFAPAAVRAAASQALAELAPQPEAALTEGAAEEPAAEDESAEPAPAGPPEHRTAQHVEVALRPVLMELSRCVRESPERPSSARLTLVLGGDGDVLAVQTLPASLQACMEPLVLRVPFPANKYGRRETLTYIVPR